MKFEYWVNSKSYTRYDQDTVCEFSAGVNIDNKVIDIRTRGVACCSPDDEYDLDFGRALAYIRAKQKANKKVEKELIKYSYKNNRKYDNVFGKAKDMLEKIWSSKDESKMRKLAEYVIKIGGMK